MTYKKEMSVTSVLVHAMAIEIQRFVRGAQGMTHDERAWFIERIEPIIVRHLSDNFATAIIMHCVPGGDICDPQQVADSIREFLPPNAELSRPAADAPQPNNATPDPQGRP